jgi:signal transduction histidine kinase/DNA-binding NarL/FixJ family response regulator
MHTQMHLVTFMITMFELVMLVFQLIYFLERPGEKSRLQFLLLLVFLIMHNVCSGLFPDEQWLLPVPVQIITAYFVGFAMSMYVVYYFYKVFDLKHLKFFATYGLLFFLFLPFVFLFVVPYLLTGDSRLSAQLTVIIPFFYGLGFIYNTARALIFKFRTARSEGKLFDEPLYEHALFMYISMVCWASLPVIVFFGDFQVLEHSATNAGFLMMTIIYVRSAIKQSRREYVKLLESEKGLQDLTRTLKRKVRRRTKKLENAIEAKKTTFINLAHETKTPLTLINNYLTEYIEKHGESEEMRIIKNNVKRLTNDIVNFFDVESYERGFSVYNHDHVSNFTSLLNDKVSLFKPAAQKKKIKLQARVDNGVYVNAHPGAVDRIVNNLLENAIKYSNEGSHIETGLCLVGDCVKFYVKDSGLGIPDDQQVKVFEPYYKLSFPGKNSEGMGMGLSIVKKIVTDIKGSIELKSELGVGTQVQVFLPAVPEFSEGISREPLTNDIDWSFYQILMEETFDPNRSIILVVEDNVEMLNFLRHKLQTKYNVAVARNGIEALERLKSLTSLDLIISDVMMNEMDGFELCRAVNKMERFAHIPFIFLSAKGRGQDRLAGLNLGAVAYIQKPFELEELLARIDSILTNLKRHREAFVSKAYELAMSDANRRNLSGRGKHQAFIENCQKYRLTSREVEIITLLIKGSAYKVISSDLSISEKTVSKHISNIFSKVEVNNKIELINRLQAQELLSGSQTEAEQ